MPAPQPNDAIELRGLPLRSVRSAAVPDTSDVRFYCVYEVGLDPVGFDLLRVDRIGDDLGHPQIRVRPSALPRLVVDRDDLADAPVARLQLLDMDDPGTDTSE
jgi:hypothetical protein